MHEPPNSRETPRSVDLAAGLSEWSPDERTLNSPLGAWFYEMRDVPFDEWTDYDVRRSVRQGEYVGPLIPRALALLKDDPLAGGYWTGDLLQLFTQIPSQYWDAHPDQKALAVEAAQAALKDRLWIDEVLEDHEDDIQVIISAIASGTIPKAPED